MVDDLNDGLGRLSPTLAAAFLGCNASAAWTLEARRGLRKAAEPADDPQVALVVRKGHEHEGYTGRGFIESVTGNDEIDATVPIIAGTAWAFARPELAAKLHSEAGCATQRLVLTKSAHPTLKATGLSFFPVEHSGCRQKSSEEAEATRDILMSLLGQRVIDRDGRERAMTLDDVLALQHASEPAPLMLARRRPGWHRRQIPGSGSGGGDRLDDDFWRR